MVQFLKQDILETGNSYNVTTSYHHSISNRLFLALSVDELSYVITDKNLEPVKNGVIAVPDVQFLQEALNSTPPLGQIFGAVTLVFLGNNFVCTPAIFSSEKHRKMLYTANHKLAPDERLMEGSLTPEIATIYAAESAKLEILKSKYPSLVYCHEIETIYQFIQTEIKPTGVNIVLKQRQNDLLVFVANGKNLLLVNQFDARNQEDIFYYTMLAVEQLELDIEHTTLFWSANEDFMSFDKTRSLFENYIKNIKLIDHLKGVDPIHHMSIKCG